MMNKKSNAGKIILLPIALIFFLASCTQKKEVVQPPEPLTLSYYTPDFTGDINFSDPVAKEITRRTGIKLDIFHTNSENNDIIALMIADNSYTDLIFAKGDISDLIEHDAILPLDDLIETCGENIKKLYGNQLSRLRYSVEDPRIYSLCAYEIKQEVNEPSGSLQIQNAVLKEFGYPKIQTLEDYENLLLAYKKKYPVINGHKTLGFSFVTTDWFWFVDLSNPGNFVLGYGDDGQWIINQKTYEATYKFLAPKMDTYYRWLNRLYQEDLLDPDSFTQSLDLWKTKMADGYILGTSCPFYQISDIQSEISRTGQPERSYAFLPITAKKGILEPSLKDYGFSGGWGIAITKNCKNPERAFEFLDWLCSEEAQILTNWGFEGQDYYYDSHGKRISLNDPVVDKQRGVGQWAYPFPQAGTAYLDSTGNYFGKSQKHNIISNYNQAEKETLNAYGVTTWSELFPSSEKLGTSEYGQVWQYPLNSNSQKLVDRVDNYVREALIEMIMDDPENFDEHWNTMCENIRATGIDKVGKEITEKIIQKMNFWSY